MKAFKVLILLCLCALAVTGEDAKEDKADVTQTTLLQKSEPYQRKSEEPSLLSRIKNWIYPTSDATQVPDNKAVAGHHVPQYIAPPRPIHRTRPDCDPCNKEPWVPIATNYGKNTVVSFVQSSEVHNSGGSIDLLKPPNIQQQYGVPNFQPLQGYNGPSQSYGAPQSLQNPNYATSTNNFVLSPPPVSNQYGPPPVQNYGPPRAPNYGPPPPLNYGSPPNQNYGPPPKENYGPPPNQNYGPPPKQNYGPPPKQNYGPPPNHGPPKHHQKVPKFGPPRPNYGPPRQNLPPLPNFFRPPPAKGQYNPPRFISKPRPPHQNYGPPFHVPIGMKPPPLNGFVTNYGVPPTSQVPFGQYGLPILPSVIPSDSYGTPITGANADYALSAHTTNIALDPTPTISLQQFDDILPIPNGPIPLPNLNQYPMAPLHGPQDFNANVYHEADSQESRQAEVVNINQIHPSNSQKQEDVTDVQIVKSIPLSTYLSSVDYPITLIQSPLVDVSVSPIEAQKSSYENSQIKLSDNPIIVDSNYDNYASGTAHNDSFTNFKRDNDKDVLPSYSQEVTEILPNPNAINQLIEGRDLNTEKPTYTQPPVDYTSWAPSTNQFISTSMIPPTPGPSTWLTSIGKGEELPSTTQPPRQYQIIIPYTSKQTLKGRKAPPYIQYETKLSMYTQPPTTESEWLKYTEFYDSQKITTPKPLVINIKDLLKKEKQEFKDNSLPYDILNLQKNIDDWTAQEYSKDAKQEYLKLTTIPQSVQSKEIPKDFFITKAYNFSKTTTPKYFYDHEPAGSHQNENKLTTIDDFENNFIITDTTLPSTTTDETTTTDIPETTESSEGFTHSNWNSKTEISSSKEKIYVVTPEPLIRTTTPHSNLAFSHPPKIGGKTAKQVKDDYNNNLRLILSEWPHLINNLETTTSARSTSAHPLFGLMDLSSYIPPENSTIQTYSGHSKVITIVTPVSVQKNRSSIESTTRSSTLTES